MHVVIIGAGIGGLALSAALQRYGIPFELYERRTDIMGGAAIGLAQNALSALGSLNLVGEVTQLADVIRYVQFRSPEGQILKKIDLVSITGIERPAVCVQRQTLLHALLGASGSMPPRFSMEAEQISSLSNQSGASVRFTSGEQAEASLVVAADGVRSCAREFVAGASAALRYSGTYAWRGLSPYDPNSMEPNTAVLTWGPGSVFGFAPAGQGSMYWFGTRIAPAEEARANATKEAALKCFGAWAKPIPQLIETTMESQLYCHPLFDRTPLETWSRDSVVLIGDAAHPMTPSTGQGGAQALQDAVVLAECLKAHGTTPEALQTFETRRMTIANRVVLLSRRATHIEHVTNPVLYRIRNLLLQCYPAKLAYSLVSRHFT